MPSHILLLLVNKASCLRGLCRSPKYKHNIYIWYIMYYIHIKHGDGKGLAWLSVVLWFFIAIYPYKDPLLFTAPRAIVAPLTGANINQHSRRTESHFDHDILNLYGGKGHFPCQQWGWTNPCKSVDGAATQVGPWKRHTDIVYSITHCLRWLL